MGTIEKNKTGLGDALFSKTQRQILGLLFGHPDKSFYAKEIVRFAGVGIGTVQRELERLSSAGLLTIKKVGNQKHYQVNRKSAIFEELRGIVLKTFGFAEVLRQALGELADRIQAAFVYGSIAKGSDTADSDVDIMIIADNVSYGEVFSALSATETKLGRTVSPTLYTRSEFKTKLASDSSFLTRIVDQRKIFLIGSQNDIPAP